MVNKKSLGLILLFGMLFFLAFFVFAVQWNEGIENFQALEDYLYFYNVSLNVTNVSWNLEISFIPDQTDSIQWDNGATILNFTSLEQIPWFFYNYSSFILRINSTLDNQSGKFRILFRAKDNETLAGVNNYLFFIINATNDAPVFLNLQNFLNPYNTSAPVGGSSFFNVSFSGWDEEVHYPLEITSLNFLECAKAPWTNTSNCFLENSFYSIGNTTLIINFTNLTKENVGIYNLSVCIKDNINSTINYPIYRVSDYNENKTSCQNFSLNVFYYLSIDASNCSGLSLVEGQDLFCYINVTTKKSSESFNIWSNAFLNFSNADSFINQLTGKDWFLSLNQNNSQDFFKQVFINITNLTKINVGNWTINVSVNLTDGSFASQNISFFVNKTNFVPVFLFNFSNPDNKTAVNSLAYFNFSFYDEDFLIPDKKFYNETINLTIRVFNNFSGEEVFWQNFTNRTFVYQGNSSYSNQSLIFTSNISQVGIWRINFSYLDKEGNYGEENFFFEVLSNQPPMWNQTIIYVTCLVNSTESTTDFCLQNINLTNSSNGFLYAYDLDNDTMGFSVIGQAPPSFSLTQNGILNFKPWKRDVSIYRGNWDFNLSVSDPYFTNSSLRFIINVSNVNSLPRIENLSYPLSTDENNLTLISFRVYDDDLLIPLGYTSPREGNFTFSKISYALSGQQNLSLSDFSDWSHLIDGSSNNFLVNFSFTPNKSHVGNHTINISVYDRFGISTLNWTAFNITVFGINNKPEFSQNLTNISTAIGRNFYLKVNATDIEDGDDSQGNLVFNYSLLSRTFWGRNTKTERIFDCEGCFNFTRGIFNLSLNQSHAGVYAINVSVMDRGYSNKPNETSWQVFWLFFYDYPEILSPAENFQFNFSENSTQNFIFLANHSVGDPLVYEIYVDRVKCAYQNPNSCIYENLTRVGQTIYLGNGINEYNFSRYFGFDEETYGNLKNLTLVVYPASESLDNKSLLNSSRNFKLNITHVNFPPNISNIGAHGSTYGTTTPIRINMSQYVFDYDKEDSFYKENLTYYIQSTSSRSEIYLGSTDSGDFLLPKITNNSLIELYALKELSETLYVIANDSSNNSVRSNNFSVVFSSPNVQQVQVPSSGGGSSATQTKFVSLSISVPTVIRAKLNDSLEVPIIISNSGEMKISQINIVSGFKQISDEKIMINLSSDFIESLDIGQSKNITAYLKVDARRAGRYLAFINASSNNPRIFQEANFYIEIETIPGVNVEEVLVFTEKILADNPECAELRERVREVEKLRENGDFEKAIKLANEIVDSCKKTISQKRNFIIFQREVPKVIFILASSIVIIFIAFISFIIYKRVKFNKSIKEEYI
ncbi:MAG: hypothetical protein QXX68_02140 [Candidatus Pacearchaeota archaeon]